MASMDFDSFKQDRNDHKKDNLSSENNSFKSAMSSNNGNANQQVIITLEKNDSTITLYNPEDNIREFLERKGYEQSNTVTTSKRDKGSNSKEDEKDKPWQKTDKKGSDFKSDRKSGFSRFKSGPIGVKGEKEETEDDSDLFYKGLPNFIDG